MARIHFIGICGTAMATLAAMLGPRTAKERRRLDQAAATIEDMLATRS